MAFPLTRWYGKPDRKRDIRGVLGRPLCYNGSREICAYAIKRKDVVYLEEPVHTKAGRLAMTLIVLFGVLFLLAALAFGIFKGMGLKFCTVEGESMLPTVESDMRLLLNPKTKVKRFDIIVFKVEGRYLIKRVIGLPGDEISVKSGVLFVNGERRDEPYLDSAYCKEYGETNFDVRVSEGDYFLMGDNRDNSMDSRDIGLVHESAFVGVPIFRID